MRSVYSSDETGPFIVVVLMINLFLSLIIWRLSLVHTDNNISTCQYCVDTYVSETKYSKLMFY